MIARNDMLVLTRRAGESIMIDDEIERKVLKIRGSQVHLGIEAPRNAAVHRKEVWVRIQAEPTELAVPVK
jgi:carbon storage regulator